MANFIEFPVFDGVSGDLKQWILWLEEFFVRERFTAMEKMNLAQSLLADIAEAWFYRNQKILPFQSWEELKFNLWVRFGDFADYDRFLQAIRAEARIQRRKRMETTSITPQESISSPATIHETVPIDNFSNQQVDEISGEKKDESHEATLVKVLDNLEEASVTQNQVPVSKLEPSLQIPKDSPNVCENSQAVVGCEHQRSFQKNIRMDVVNGVVERSQRVMSITKNVFAHQVLDKTSAHKERLKPKSKRKLSLSLKTWRFKFKHTSKKRKSLDVKFSPVEEIVAGCEKKLYDRFQTSPSYALDVVNKTSKPWETHTPFTSTPVASVNSLSFAVATEEKMSSGLFHTSQVWEPGGVLADHVLMDWLRAFNGYDGIVDGIKCLDIGVCSGIKQLIDSRRASRVWERGGLAISTDRLLHSGFDGNKLPQSHKLKVDKIELQLDPSDITLGGLQVEIASLLEVNCVLAECLRHKAAGSLERVKANLVAKGYAQRKGVYFIATFSHIAKLQKGYASRKGDLPENAVFHLKKLSDAPLAIVDIRRHGHNVAEGMNLIRDVNGKVAIMVDDMSDTAYNFQLTILAVENLLGETIGRVHDDCFLVLERTVSHEWHRWKHKTASVTSNDRVIAADIGRQAATSSSMLPLYVYQLGVSDKEIVADPVPQCLLGTLLWSTSFKKQRFGKNWWYKFKHRLWQRLLWMFELMFPSILLISLRTSLVFRG